MNCWKTIDRAMRRWNNGAGVVVEASPQLELELDRLAKQRELSLAPERRVPTGERPAAPAGGPKE